MNLTTERLKRLIKEELEVVMQEGYFNRDELTQKALNQYKHNFIDYEELGEKLKQIGLSAEQEKLALDAARRKGELEKQGKNTPFGDYRPDAPENQVGYDPNSDSKVVTFEPNKQDKEVQKRIQDRAQKIARELGGQEQFIKNMIDVSNGKYKNSQDVFADLTKIRMPPSRAQLINVGNRVEGFLDALETSKKKPGFFANLRSKLPFEE
jgi:hypothetical protein